MKKIVLGIFIFLFSFYVHASESPRAYATLGAAFLTFDDGLDTIEPTQIIGRLGYDFNENIGIGVEGGFSLIEDELYGVDFDVSTLFFYLKGSLPVSEDVKIYGMIGPTNTEVTGSSGGISVSADDDDTGIGLGFEKALESSAFSIDYIKYNDNDGVDAYAFNISTIRNLC